MRTKLVSILAFAAMIVTLFVSSQPVAAVPPAGCEPPPVNGTVADWLLNDGVTAEFNEIDELSGEFSGPPDTRTITFGTESGTFPDALTTDEDANVLQYTETLDSVPVPEIQRLDVRMDWVDFPDGPVRQLRFSAWRSNENMNVFVGDTGGGFHWQLIGIVTTTAGTGTQGDFTWTLNATQWNGGDVAVRFADDPNFPDLSASNLFLDRTVLVTEQNNFVMNAICGWAAGTGDRLLRFDGWSRHGGVPEEFLLQVRSFPGSTFNTRYTIPVGADGTLPVFEYQLTDAEFHDDGTIEIRFVGSDETFDGDFGILEIDQFTLEQVPPSVTTLAANGVTASTARLNGNLDDPGSGPTEVYFEWGDTPALGTETSHTSKNAPGGFSRTISGLDQDTDYYFRACAESPAGTDCGSTLTFTTEESQLAFLQRIFLVVLWALFLIFLVAGALMFRRWRKGE